MAVHNTGSDAANTAVRAFLTRVGEKYLGHGFNTGSGRGKQIWEEIRGSFEGRCAYCDLTPEGDRLTIEHLTSFNRQSGGLHHPGNVVPCCRGCNRRQKVDGRELAWEDHLADIVQGQGLSIAVLRVRKKRIDEHRARYEHPVLSDKEVAAITTIAQDLYVRVSEDVNRGVNLIWSIHEDLI